MSIKKSGTVSRVLSCAAIYLGTPSPGAQATYPKRSGQLHSFCLVLLRMGFTLTHHVTMMAVSSYLTISPLPQKRRFHFCCTFPGVTSAGRYPASCPMKPGLSSCERSRPRPHIPLASPRTSLFVGPCMHEPTFRFVAAPYPHKVETGDCPLSPFLTS